ncbi:MAG: hypothetical protein WAZ12_00310 [Candidatus Absconditicoccaceae bacterium]
MENLENANPEEGKMVMRILSALKEDYIHHMQQERGKYHKKIYCQIKGKDFTLDEAITEVRQMSQYGLFLMGNYVNALIIRPTY